VPVHGGVLSALGMLAAPRKRNLSRTVQGLLADWSAGQIQQGLDRLAQQASQALLKEGVAEREQLRFDSLDLRYLGQSSTLEITWSDIQTSLAAFHQKHCERYGHALDQPIELVNLRIALTGPSTEPPLQQELAGTTARAVHTVKMANISQPVPVYERDQLYRDQLISGPALITETVATTWLAPGWCASVHDNQSLVLKSGKL